MKYNPSAHKYRRTAIHVVLAFIIIMIAFMASSCSSAKRVGFRKYKDPCKERRGMSGYGYGFINMKIKNK
jgi:hypothetical protein